MKIDSKMFETFVKKCSLNGTIKTGIIRGNGQELTMKSKSTDAIAVYGMLNNVKDEVCFPIKDNNRLLKILNIFKGTINSEVQNNMLKLFNENDEGEIILADESFIDNEVKKQPDIPYEGEIKLNAAFFQSAIKNREIVEAENYILEVKDNILSIITGDKNFDKLRKKIKVDHKDCKIELSSLFDNIVKVLSGEVTVFLGTDKPIKIIEKTPEMTFVYFIADLETQEE